MRLKRLFKKWFCKEEIYLYPLPIVDKYIAPDEWIDEWIKEQTELFFKRYENEEDFNEELIFSIFRTFTYQNNERPKYISPSHIYSYYMKRMKKANDKRSLMRNVLRWC